MKINKPLSSEISSLSALIKNKLSEAKTSCKAFVSLLKQYSETESYYSMSLLRIAQTGLF